MSLIDIWQSSPGQLREKHVQQVMAFAGDGKLLDGSKASQEFRAFLSQIDSSHLARFADECLTTKFDNSGLVLQDTVNEIGRRLGFEVQDGRYRGTAKDIGFDGLWRSLDGFTIVVEVKTTDAYRIDLNTIADYRRELARGVQLREDASSILIVVGRQDTGDLEAQIRGSRHAWDIRLISTDALRRLVSIKEEIEDPQTVRQISALLTPMEFTRLDGIIDLVFAAAAEVLEEEPSEPAITPRAGVERKTPKFIPVSFNQACADRVKQRLGIELLKRSKATFSSPDGKTVLICSVSKTHGETPEEAGYWFAFHPHQRDALDAADTPLLAYGCGSADAVLLVPYDKFRNWLAGLNMTRVADKEYWHVHIHREDGRYVLHRKSGQDNVDLTPFLMKP